MSPAARRYRRPRVKDDPAEPTRYGQLVDDVLSALKRSSLEATGWEWSIGGLGTGEGAYTGWCPVCARGLVHIQLFATNPPETITGECSAGCPSDLVTNAIWPPRDSPPTTSTDAAAANS